MQALRPVLRRHLPAIAHRRLPLLRFQNSNYGPHKEYFQTPGQSPLPDTTPYDPRLPIETVVTSSGPSRLTRAWRSLGWAILFTSLGLSAGATLITWEYLQPPFEPGSPEEQELYAEIVETLDTHPLVDQLRNEKWVEENFYAARQHGGSETGMNLVSENLTGIQGLTIKAFRHPDLDCTMLVFFAGFGVEGWPDVVHGGVTTAMFLEAAKRHHQTYYSDFIEMDDSSVEIDFRRPLRPGEVYALLVPPASKNPLKDTQQDIVLTMASLLMRLEAAPKIVRQTGPNPQVETLTLEIPGTKEADVTHAIGIVQMVTRLKDGAQYPNFPFSELPANDPVRSGKT